MMIYRTEHPKPQFMRDGWLNLNGEWQFEFDQSNSGAARGLSAADAVFSQTINVPFCPESKLSGIGFTDYINAVWYKRTVTLTEEQCAGRVVLHFGAVDYQATAYVNGKECGTHKGGYTSFSFDITDYVQAGDNVITVHAEDDTRNPLIASGKQSMAYASDGCFYTRTTGIWQTVWLEFTPRTYVAKVKYFPNAENASLTVQAELVGAGTLTAEAFFEGRSVGCAVTASTGGHSCLSVSLSEKHLWEVGDGKLYDLVLTYGDDKVTSYFGLRSVRIDGRKFRINGKSVFQRMVLDQGFYPDGIYTAPSDTELLGDIERSMAMGFNGARLHEKIFEERFLYHCDRMGYIVWGEYPNWGLRPEKPGALYAMLPEWMEAVERDFNHPAIIGWCPFNEVWEPADDVLKTVYQVTKAMDNTRPCIDISGYIHPADTPTDIYDVHDYEQDPATLRAHYSEFPEKAFNDLAKVAEPYTRRQIYKEGLPLFVSEYGGIAWDMDGTGWGYGNAPKTEEEFLTRLKGLTDVLLDHPAIMGLCYTQLTDVEQEQNGLYTYSRVPKFDPAVIRAIFTRKAAIEEE